MVKISDKAVLLAMAHAFGIYALFVERKIKPSPEVPLPSNLLQNHRAEHLPYMSEPLTSALNAMEADVSPEKILARRRARSISNRIDQQLSPPMPNSLPSCNNPDIEDEKDDYQDFMLLAFN